MGADPWLISFAKINNAAVVTQEAIVDESSTVVKIPNICEEFNVKYYNIFQLIETLSPRSVLAST